MSMPLVSIVIPVFNRQIRIVSCLENIISQSYKNIEIIIVDDCSTDSTLDVISNISDIRIRVVSLKESLGAQAARNAGIKKSSGEWIAFQDSDDVWQQEKLEKQVSLLAKYNFNDRIVLHSNCWKFDEVTGQRTAWYLPETGGEDAYKQLLKRPAPMYQSILVSKKALEEIGYLDEKVPSYQEWDTSIRLAKICNFIHMNELLFTYNLHEEDTISKNDLRSFLGYRYIYKKFEQDILEQCGENICADHMRRQLQIFFDSQIYKYNWDVFDYTKYFYNDISRYYNLIDFSINDVSTMNLFRVLSKRIFRFLAKRFKSINLL